MGEEPLKVLYEDNHLLVVVKPVGVLSQSDGSKTEDMLTLLKSYLKEKYNKKGNVYLGLVHRLDKDVGGVMVFAKTSKAARRLSEQIRTKQIEKGYLAVVKGRVVDSVYEDYIKRVEYRSVIGGKDDGKYARLSFKVLEYKNDNSLVEIKLETGRHHQIRVQFASRNHPLLGDSRYGEKGSNKIALFHYHLAFFHPITKEKLIFEQFPDNGYFKEYINSRKNDKAM